MGDSGSNLTDAQLAKLDEQIARHKAILESMDPERFAELRAQAAIAMQQPTSTTGKWERVQSLMTSDAVLNCPDHQNHYATLQELHDEVHRLSERRRLSDGEFAAKVDELLPRVEEAARVAKFLSTITYS